MPQSAPAPTLLLAGKHALDHRHLLDPQIQHLDLEVKIWGPNQGLDVLNEQIKEASILVPGADLAHLIDWRGPLSKAENLKLIQLPLTGYDWLPMDAIPAGCVVANAYGHEIAVAEYVIGALIRWEVRYGDLDMAFRSSGWLGLGESDFGRRRHQLKDKTLGLIGYGAIAKEVAKRAAAFDMRLIAVSRSHRTCPQRLDWYGTMEHLPKLLQESDYVVIACSLTQETKGLIDAQALALMPSHAVLVNIARGPIVDEQALYKALHERQIEGAILDVWYNYPEEQKDGALSYPPPSDLAFERLENVIVTPHIAARTEGAERLRWAHVGQNIALFLQGQSIGSTVMMGKIRK